MRNPPNYYARQTEGVGFTMWRFATRKQRDEWVGFNLKRRAVAADQVERAFKAKGVFWRWGLPQFCRPVVVDENERAAH